MAFTHPFKHVVRKFMAVKSCCITAYYTFQRAEFSRSSINRFKCTGRTNNVHNLLLKQFLIVWRRLYFNLRHCWQVEHSCIKFYFFPAKPATIFPYSKYIKMMIELLVPDGMNSIQVL